MTDPIGPSQIARLEACVASDPGAPEFAVLCEALRGEGRLAEAEAVARSGLAHKPDCLEGVLALALVLLDQGRFEAARQLLEGRAAERLALRGPAAESRADSDAGERDVPDFAAEVTDSELERAFAAAEPDRDQLVDADRVAQVAMRAARVDEPEADALGADPMFATRTMAELLERQGDSGGAARIREALTAAEDPVAADAPATADLPVARRSGAWADRSRIVATLETWLHNLRRESR